MPRYLLLPADEREFGEWLVEQHGLQLLVSDRLDGDGNPDTASLDAMPCDLPGPVTHGSTDPAEFRFWHPSWRVNDLDPWEGNSTVSSVAVQLNAEAAQAHSVPTDRLFDVERSEVIRLRRSRWTRDGSLQVAAIQASARPANLLTPRNAALLRSAERWLAVGSTTVPSPSPQDKGTILARTAAAAWVADGGQVHPWG